MNDKPIVFDDGESYEKMMGVWSRGVGETFIDWLQPAAGLRWADIGCGTGAFSQLVFDRCAPSRLDGLDPSEEQLDYARTRLSGKAAHFVRGDATALPWADNSFDVAVMALVIFFVPDPAKGVAEMARITKPGGVVCAYAWDIPGGGFPVAPLQDGMRAVGIKVVMPPSADASRLQRMGELWTEAGLVDVETRVLPARRVFANFEEYWEISIMSASTRAALAQVSQAQRDALKEHVRSRVKSDSAGRIEATAHANAARGRKAG
jgi:ubiquinone/menaquinone biosynthesis C-methylase UbiE